MVHKMCLQEFDTRSLTLNYERPEDFTRSHWQKKERVIPIWIVYRLIMALYFLVSFAYTLVDFVFGSKTEDFIKYPIFLTHWAYFIETIYFNLGLILVAAKANDEHKKRLQTEPMKFMPWHYKMYWILYTVCLPGAFAVSIIFWAEIYNPEEFPLNLSNIMVHVLNSVFILIELILVAHPTKILHFYVPLSFAFVYCLFSLIYQVSGGTGVKNMIPIYIILDWRYPGGAIVTCSVSLLFLVFLHVLLSLFHTLKFFFKKRLIVSQEEEHLNS